MGIFAAFWAYHRILSPAFLHGRLLGKNKSISAVKPYEGWVSIFTLMVPW
jgi:hypothetical protein